MKGAQNVPLEQKVPLAEGERFLGREKDRRRQTKALALASKLPLEKLKEREKSQAKKKGK